MTILTISVSCVYKYSQGAHPHKQRIKYGKGKRMIIKNSPLNYARHTFVNFDKVRLSDGTYIIDTTEKTVFNPLYKDDKKPFISRKLQGSEIVKCEKRRAYRPKNDATTSTTITIESESIPKTVEKIIELMILTHKRDIQISNETVKLRANWLIRLKAYDDGRLLKGNQLNYTHKLEVYRKANGKLQVNNEAYKALSFQASFKSPTVD